MEETFTFCNNVTHRRSCVRKVPMVKCQSILSIDTLDRHPNGYLVDALLTLNQRSVNN